MPGLHFEGQDTLKTQLVHMCVCAVLRLQRHFGHSLPNVSKGVEAGKFPKHLTSTSAEA